MNEDVKQYNAAIQGLEDEFRREYQLFIDTLKSMPLLRRLAFCRDLLLNRL